MSNANDELDSLRLGDPRTIGGGGGADDDDEEGNTTAESDLESGAFANGVDNARNSLLGDRAAREERAARLAKASAVIASADKSLDRTSRALADTERIGAQTSAQLLAQREAFQRQRAKLAKTDEYLARSKGILSRMQHRIVTDKVFQAVIILAEIAVIVTIVYYKYYR